MRIVTLSSEQFDKFAQSHRYRNYYQTSAYGTLMTKFGYDIFYLGIVSDTNKLIGATLILYKQVFMSNKIAYAPRGMLFNYENAENLDEAMKKIRQVLGKKGFMLLRIDPYIPLNIRDADGRIINSNNQGNKIIENLKSVGFTYKGKTKSYETEKPRWEGLIILDKNIEEAFSQFEKRTRNKLRKAINFGIEAYKDNTKNIEKLYSFIKDNEKKTKNYYRRILDIFGENAEIYYAKINTETYTINSRRAYEKELENNSVLSNLIQDQSFDEKQKNNILNKKMESDKLLDSYKNSLIHATALLKQYPEGIIIGGAIVIIYDNAAFIITEGVDSKYKLQNSDYVLKWKMIEEYTKRDLKYLNIGGLVDNSDKNSTHDISNERKLGFNTTVSEYIGEFDIVLNKFSYNLYKSFNGNRKNKKNQT